MKNTLSGLEQVEQYITASGKVIAELLRQNADLVKLCQKQSVVIREMAADVPIAARRATLDGSEGRKGSGGKVEGILNGRASPTSNIDSD